MTIFDPRHIDDMDEQESNGGPNHLRAWRKRARMSLEELAKQVGTTHQVIGYLERGRTQLSAKWLRKLAPILKTTPGLMLDHDPEDLSEDMIEMWTAANEDQRRQLTEIGRTILRNGTNGR